MSTHVPLTEAERRELSAAIVSGLPRVNTEAVVERILAARSQRPTFGQGDGLEAVLAEAGDQHDYPTETDDGLVMRCRCGATPPSHLLGQQVDEALWLWEHRQAATAACVRAHYADRAARHPEGVTVTEALRALSDEATPGPWGEERCRQGSRLLSAVTAPSVPTGDGSVIAVVDDVLPEDGRFIAAACNFVRDLLAGGGQRG